MNIVERLVDEKGLSKWRVSRVIGVSWNTVQMWYRGVFLPSPQNQEKLKELDRETKR